MTIGRNSERAAKAALFCKRNPSNSIIAVEPRATEVVRG
jgi:hypothetical protein